MEYWVLDNEYWVLVFIGNQRKILYAINSFSIRLILTYIGAIS